MQAVQFTFLALLLAHLFGDFLLQPKWIVKNKDKKLWPLICHGLVHYGLAWVCLSLFAPVTYWSVYNEAVLAGYITVHLLIDKLKCQFIARKKLSDNWQAFLLDQLLHVITLAIAVCILDRCHPTALLYGFSLSPSTRIQIVEAAIIYTSVVFGGGYFIRYLTMDLAVKSTHESRPQLENAGLYIGWIERFLIVTAIAVQSPVLVGLILTGKSIARYPEFKEARFAEYFLIGTLLSISFSLVGGILLLHLVYGAVSLK